MQKLVRLVGLCKLCHLTTHFGLARMNGQALIAMKHLQKVRGFELEQSKEHIEMAFAIWNERNQYKWTLDLSLITSNDFGLVIPTPNSQKRIKIASKKLETKIN